MLLLETTEESVGFNSVGTCCCVEARWRGDDYYYLADFGVGGEEVVSHLGGVGFFEVFTLEGVIHHVGGAVVVVSDDGLDVVDNLLTPVENSPGRTGVRGTS